jgi:hypothetical protein
MAIMQSVLLMLLGAIYVGLVLMTYVVFGPTYSLKLDAEAPLISAERLAVWLGVRAVNLVVRGLKTTWNLLSEASAEVGDWLVSRASQEIQAAYRSKFL